jgi:hypothetical protein
MKRKQSLIFLFLAVFLLTGCNIFQFTASPTSADDYISSGRTKITEGDYDGALSDFANAMSEDNFNSEARYLHAKTSLLVCGFNVINVVTEMSESEDGGELPFFDWAIADANQMFRANVVIHQDLEPIYLEQTHGPIVFDDVQYDYTVAVLIESILSLRDTNGDGYIDENDFDLTFLFGENGLDLENLLEFWNSLGDLDDQARADAINTLLGSGIDLIDIPLLLFPDLFGEDSPYNTEELDSLALDIEFVLQLYMVNDGIDNDQDGVVDEEAIDGIDNDSDGLTDEDTHY